MATLTAKQIYDLSRQAGFDPASAVIATAIALAESKGNPSAIGDINVPAKGASSVGLWQINYSPLTMGPSPYRDPVANLDPLTNAKAAYAISSAGKNFAPWATYTSGAYKNYLPAATAAAPAGSGDTGGTIGAPTPKSSGLHIPGTPFTIGNPLNALATGTEKVVVKGLFLLAGLGLIVLGLSRMAGIETKDIIKGGMK